MTKEQIEAEQLLALLRAASTRWLTIRSESDTLDAILGDGDHGSSLANGFASAIEGLSTEMTISELLLQTATQLMNRMGGAAGALLGSFFLGLATASQGKSSLDLSQFATACASGLTSVRRRSHANLGDKTLLDALEPAVRALEEGGKSGLSFSSSLKAAALAAKAGAEATIPLVAKHGRAKFLGPRSCGHMDAGAYSVSALFDAWSNSWVTLVE